MLLIRPPESWKNKMLEGGIRAKILYDRKRAAESRRGADIGRVKPEEVSCRALNVAMSLFSIPSSERARPTTHPSIRPTGTPTIECCERRSAIHCECSACWALNKRLLQGY